MRHITFAARAAVTATALSLASGATAATVDSLEDQTFFASMNSDTESAAPMELTIGINAGTQDEFDEVTSVELVPAEELFERPLLVAEPHAIGIAMERAHVDMVYAKGQSTTLGMDPMAVERGFMRAPLSSATSLSSSLTAAPVAGPIVPASAANMAVPLPASGILLCFGLLGLARFSRRSA